MISIAGYSPYKDIDELLDPVGVEKDKSKWGVITRLLHLDDSNNPSIDSNCPFRLYERKKVGTQFKKDKGDVSVETSDKQPAGIGVLEIKTENVKNSSPGVSGSMTTEEQYLADPLTKETISKVKKTDETGRPILDRFQKQEYQINDHWFILNFKLVWKDAPKVAEQAGAGGVAASPAPTPAPVAPTPSRSSGSSGSKRRDIGDMD